MSRMTNPESSNLLNAMHFATHGLYVTQRKDAEPNLAHACNAYDVESPLFRSTETARVPDVALRLSY